MIYCNTVYILFYMRYYIMVNKAYLINLDSRPDRLQTCLTEFENIKSIEIVRFPAIKADPTLMSKNPPGAVACIKSHIEILKNNLDKNENILVLEDDVKLINKETFDENWTKVKEWLDKNEHLWDTFTGGSVFGRYGDVKSILNNELSIVSLQKAYSSHFIYYNKYFIKNVINLDPCKAHADGLHLYYPNIRIAIQVPLIATQHTSSSDVSFETKDWSDNFSLSEDNYKRRLNVLRKKYN